MPEYGGSEGIGVRSIDSVGTIECIGYDCFDVFDYVERGLQKKNLFLSEFRKKRR